MPAFEFALYCVPVIVGFCSLCLLIVMAMAWVVKRADEDRAEMREQEIDDLYTVWSLDAYRERRGIR